MPMVVSVILSGAPCLSCEPRARVSVRVFGKGEGRSNSPTVRSGLQSCDPTPRRRRRVATLRRRHHPAAARLHRTDKQSSSANRRKPAKKTMRAPARTISRQRPRAPAPASDAVIDRSQRSRWCFRAGGCTLFRHSSLGPPRLRHAKVALLRRQTRPDLRKATTAKGGISNGSASSHRQRRATRRNRRYLRTPQPGVRTSRDASRGSKREGRDRRGRVVPARIPGMVEEHAESSVGRCC